MISSNILPLNNYTMYTDQMIGGGCFGEIFLGFETLKPENKVAIKRVRMKNLSPSDFQTYIENEKYILENNDHPHIIKYYDSLKINDIFFMILEYCPESLSAFVSKFPGKCVPEDQTMTIIKDIALTMVYLNSKNIIHRNLYPNNILIQDNVAKICSFTFAQIAKNIDELPGLASSVGIPLYESPEIYYKQKYSYKCDIWSLGLIFYEMLYGKFPWIGKGLQDIFESMKKNPLIFPEQPIIKESIKELIREMLTVDQEKRCDWSKVLGSTMGGED